MQPKTSLKRKRDAHDDEEDKAGEQPNRPRLFDVTLAVPQCKPVVSQPVEVASYGIDETGQRRYGAKDMLRRLRRDIPLPLNLNEGLESFVPKDSSKDTLDHVLATLLHRNIPLSGVDFVSYRNNFNKIMQTPYARQSWQIEVQRWKGTIYLDVCHLEDERELTNQEHHRFTYYGYKFESLCTTETPAATTSSSSLKLVDANVEFCTIVKLRFGSHRLLLGAEIDCFEDVNRSSASGRHQTEKAYVELKTSKLIESSRAQHTYLRHKLLRFWIQSFLGGVPSILVGFRDDNGIVQQIERLQTLRIPSIARGKWDAYVCIHFCEELLSWVKQNTEENRQYTLSFDTPYTHVTLAPSTRAPFLPSFFLSSSNDGEEGRSSSTSHRKRPDRAL